MVDYGIKVMKEGYSVSNTDIRNIYMSSKYSMLKFHSDVTSYVTFTPGDSHKYVDFTHNLGYTPAFISFFDFNGKIYNINASGAQGPGTSINAYSWADSTKIRCGLVYTGNPYNRKVFYPSNGNDYWTTINELPGGMLVGTLSGDKFEGALRTPSVTIAKNETIVSAELTIEFGSHGTEQKDIKLKIYGIDVDNVSSFNSSPYGQAETSASVTNQVNQNNTKTDINVKSIVEEITTRSNWASGNAMGFFVKNNNTEEGVWIEDDYSGNSADSHLTITYGSSVNYNFRVIIFKDKLT